MSDTKQVVLFVGPPGSGKGTQADILAEEQGFTHLESSAVIAEQLGTHEDDETFEAHGKTYRYGDEREKRNTGALMTPEVVSAWMEAKIRQLAAEGKSLAFSGSPRTLFEAQQQLPLHEELYGKENIYAFFITVPPEESVERNSHRRLCRECRHTVPYTEETKALTVCPNCGGELIQREDDKPDIIRHRLDVYREQTLPVADAVKARGIPLHEIDGVGTITDVAARIRRVLTT
jgi:adenylate kinase